MHKSRFVFYYNYWMERLLTHIQYYNELEILPCFVLVVAPRDHIYQAVPSQPCTFRFPSHLPGF